MQRALVLIAPPSLSLEQMRQRLVLDASLAIAWAEDGDLEVRTTSDPKNYVSVGPAPDRELAIRDYSESDELDEGFRATVADQEFIVLLANSMPLLRRVARAALELSGPAAWVDDDYGHVIQAQSFLSRLDRDPEWNLRAETE
jgi:hypothetical protein